VKLPPFEEERPTAWFKSAEVMLNLHGVRDCEMWFYYTQWALTSQQKKLVDGIISMEPTPPDEYDLLKRRLLGLYDKGEQERFARFCQLPDLGSRRPSKLLAEMRALYHRGEEGSNAFRCEFFFRLPPTIQGLLGEDNFSSVTELAARADILTATTARSTATIHAMEEEAEITGVRQENSKKTKRFSRQRKGRNVGAAGGGGAPRLAPSRGSNWACAMPTTGTAVTPTRRTCLSL
jgi:hypothetical protein